VSLILRIWDVGLALYVKYSLNSLHVCCMQGDLVDPFEHAYDDDEHSEGELEENHGRWLYEDKGRIIFELVLGPDEESLVSNYMRLAEHVGANMADPYGRAMQWSKFPFESDKAQVDLNTCDAGASRWDAGIHVDVGRCRELGMSQPSAC
jgi:hypothetical protein